MSDFPAVSLDAVVASSGLDVLRSRAADAYVVQAVLAGLNLTVALEDTVHDSNGLDLAVAFFVKISLYVLL